MDLDNDELKATKRNREYKCKYCEENKTKKEKNFDITIINNCLVVGNECSEGCGYERARFNINYCMFCGKGLN